jgi:hypothetical protein
MTKKLFPVEVAIGWKVVPGQQPGVVILQIRHKALEAVRAEGTGGGTTTVLALTQDQIHDLFDDLTMQESSEARRAKVRS